jgi:hypothetical protein
MTDEELLGAFDRGELGAADFPHERHIRVAWLLAREPDGLERLTAGIRGIAERAGVPEGTLLDRSLLERYYSPAVLESGRDRWVEPDLRPLVL